MLLALSFFLSFHSASANVKMAITFDDLPIHGQLPKNGSRVEVSKSILATLKQFKVPEVYGFINAGKVEKDPASLEVLNLWINSGYPLGNHTYSHKSLNKISAEDFINEIHTNEKLLSEIGKKFDWHYFRYPFLHEGDTLGKRNAIRSYLKKNDYKIAQVTDDFEDWAWNEPYARCSDKKDLRSIESLKSGYMKFAMERFERYKIISAKVFDHPISHILLLHIGAFDAVMLPALLKAYQDKGVQFIPLSEAVKDPIYREDPGIYGKDDDFPFQVLQARGLTAKTIGLPIGQAFPGKELNSFCRN